MSLVQLKAYRSNRQSAARHGSSGEWQVDDADPLLLVVVCATAAKEVTHSRSSAQHWGCANTCKQAGKARSSSKGVGAGERCGCCCRCQGEKVQQERPSRAGGLTVEGPRPPLLCAKLGQACERAQHAELL